MLMFMKINNKINDNYVYISNKDNKKLYSYGKNNLLINQYHLTGNNYVQLEQDAVYTLTASGSNYDPYDNVFYFYIDQQSDLTINFSNSTYINMSYSVYYLDESNTQVEFSSNNTNYIQNFNITIPIPAINTYYKVKFTYTSTYTGQLNTFMINLDTNIINISDYIIDIFMKNNDVYLMKNNSSVIQLAYNQSLKQFKIGDVDVSIDNDVYINILDNIDLKESNVYPLINNNNNKVNFNNYNDINKSYNDGEVATIDDLCNKQYIKYTDDYIFYNYKIFKELLFTYIRPDDYKFTCDIYNDTTILYEDVIIGSLEQVNINVYILLFLDINKIYFNIKYGKFHNNLNNISIDLYKEFIYNFDMKNYYETKKYGSILLHNIVMNFLQPSYDFNVLIYDKLLNKNNSDIFKHIKFSSYKKYLNLLDYKELKYNKTININPDINQNNIGYTDVKSQYIFSKNSFFNKDNDYIYAVIQFINNNKEYSRIICLQYTESTDSYNEIDFINLPFNFNYYKIEDVIFLNNDYIYIEFHYKNITATLNGFCILINLDKNKILYQILPQIFTSTGFNLYPVKSIKNNNVYLTRTNREQYYNYLYQLTNSYDINKSTSPDYLYVNLYNYKYLENSFDMKVDIIDWALKPLHNNIQVTDDFNTIIFEDINFNKLCDQNNIIKNKNLMVSLLDNDNYINQSGIAIKTNLNYGYIKFNNKLVNQYLIDVDNQLIDTNIKYYNNDYIVINDQYNINIELFNSLDLLASIYNKYNIILIVELNNDSVEKNEYNYPKQLLLYKQKDSMNQDIDILNRIFNLTIDIIENDYHIKRFLLNELDTISLYYQY